MKRFLITLLLALSVSCMWASPIIQSQWNGARVAFLGDSITDARQVQKTNNVYWNNLADILGIEPYVYGISGHRMNQIIGQGERLLAEHGQNVDAIIVFIGTNDYNGNIPLGEWYSYSTRTTTDDGPTEVSRLHRELIYNDGTFRGRANTTVKWLKENFPDKQIIFLTPIHRGYAKFSDNNIQPTESFANACGSFISDYVQAVKEIANVWAVPVIDLNSISGLYPESDAHAGYFRNSETDRLHPNTPGQLRMAWALAYQLLAYPSRFEKYVALGFDDGPNTTTTSKVLDVLEENGVRASFFVQGNRIDKKTAKVMQRAVNLGCDVENHSFSHSHMTQSDEEEIRKEINETDALIEKYTGQKPTFFCPPYMEHNELMHKTIEHTFVYGVGSSNLTTVKEGDIILLHDTEGDDKTPELLKTLIPELKSMGYTIVTVPELFEVRGAVPPSHNGKTYTNVY